MIRLLILACACALMFGCVKVQPMSTTDLYSNCYMDDSFNQEDSCDSDDSICGDYQEAVSVEFPGLNPCLAACQTVYEKQIRTIYTGNCFNRINKGQDLCIQFCRRKYQN